MGSGSAGLSSLRSSKPGLSATGGAPSTHAAAPSIRAAEPSNPCCRGFNPCCRGFDPCCRGFDPCCRGFDPCCRGFNPCCRGFNPCCRAFNRPCPRPRSRSVQPPDSRHEIDQSSRSGQLQAECGHHECALPSGTYARCRLHHIGGGEKGDEGRLRPVTSPSSEHRWHTPIT